jgi:ABC-type multidrug transport system ATPase subunit
LLQVSHLARRYGQLSALSDVSFSIRDGEVLGVIGPNGSGKTTLFECLGGVLPAHDGAVLRDGRPLTAAERTAAIFYLPDLIAPWPAQTVGWALGFVTSYWQSLPGAGAAGVAEVVRRLEIEPLLDVRIGALSKGQRKRAMLAFGLLTPQPVLLADEPFDGLDLRQTREVAAALRYFAGQGRTLVLSIHQIADAARVCDRFVLLSGGRVRGEGTLDELSRAAAAASTDLEEIFLALTA